MTDGEAACSSFCVRELADLGCPHETTGDYRPMQELRGIAASE